MRVLVVHAHPVETSFNRTLFISAVTALKEAGHEVDACNLYEENFQAVMSREERLEYHEVPDNLTAQIKPYVDRLRAADGVVFVYPTWNYGYPAILKGYFDRIFLPGVSFVLIGGESNDRGKLVPALKNIRKAVYVTTYGGDRLRTMLMGDPPRRLARRWAWAMFGGWLPPKYLALYNIDNCTAEQRAAYIAKVQDTMRKF
jgi:putative NADPH-quinone reductase